MNLHTAGGRAGRLLLAGSLPRYSWHCRSILASSLWPCFNRKQKVLCSQEGTAPASAGDGGTGTNRLPCRHHGPVPALSSLLSPSALLSWPHRGQAAPAVLREHIQLVLGWRGWVVWHCPLRFLSSGLFFTGLPSGAAPTSPGVPAALSEGVHCWQVMVLWCQCHWQSRHTEQGCLWEAVLEMSVLRRGEE